MARGSREWSRCGSGGYCWCLCKHRQPRTLAAMQLLKPPGTTCLDSHSQLCELSNPSTPHHSLELDLGLPGPGRRLNIGTQEWPWGPGMCSRWGSGGHYCHLLRQCHRSSPDLWQQHSCFNSCNHKPWLPVPVGKCSGHAHSIPQPCNRCGITTAEEGTVPWTVSGWSWGWLHRWVLNLYGHTSLTCLSTPLLWGRNPSVRRGNITHLKWTEPAWTQPSWLMLQQLGSRPHPWQGSDSHRAERKSRLIFRAGFSSSNTNHSLYHGDSDKHTLRELVASIHITSSPHTKHIEHTVYIGMVPHKKATSRPQNITVVPRFIDKEKVK